MLFSRYHNTQERSLFSEPLGLRYKCPVNTHTLFLNVLYHCFLDLDQKPDNSVWKLHSKANVLTGF